MGRKTVTSIGTLLFALAMAIAMPILAFFGLLLFEFERDNAAALERRTQRDAKSIAVGVERQLQDIKTTLSVLATAPELKSGDLRSFHERSQLALVGSKYFVLLLDEDGQQLLNTRVPYGTALGSTADLDALKSVLSSKKVEVSGVFFGGVSQKWVFNVMMPVTESLGPQGTILLITQDSENLKELIAAEGLYDGWSAAVLDPSGRVVTTAGVPRFQIGDELTFARDIERGSPQGILHRGGDLVGYAKLEGWDWQTVVWGPVATSQTAVLSNRGVLILSGLAMVMLTILMALFLGRRLLQPIEELANVASRMGRGEIVAPIDSRIKEVNEVSIALTNASFERSEKEDRIKLVMGELTHRTKNMLTVVQAMIRQTARTLNVPEDFMRAINDRLQSYSSSIDLLANDNWKGVSLIKLLHTHLDKFAFDALQIELRGDDLQLRPEVVHALGLAFHELGTNSMKYGAFSVPEGRVRIEWEVDTKASPPQLEMTWRERGGPPVTEPSRTGFGSVITTKHVSAATSGSVQADYVQTGFCWTLRAPLAQFQTSAETSTRA